MLILTIETCKEFSSASLYTATVFTPSRLAVRITRHAISPLFAISTLSILFELLNDLAKLIEVTELKKT